MNKEEIMSGIIYYAHNLVSLKDYVGQSWGSLAHRKAIHYCCVKNNRYDSYFMRVLKKYKKTDWEWKVLGYADCQFGLDTLEKSWIWIKDSMSPNGYNTKEGGSHGKHTEETIEKLKFLREGVPLSEEHRKNISESLIGRKLTEEHCDNISREKKGKKRKAFTEEHLKNISEGLKGNTNAHGGKGEHMSTENHNAKTVICVETGIIYGAISEATRETGINLGSIWAVVNGKRKTAGNFHWKFVEYVQKKSGIKKH